jgi:hypothetical protein
MESNDAVHALPGLARETRLATFCGLVQTGPGGRAAGEIAPRFDRPGATLSCHLSQLSQCGFLRSRRVGRRIDYSVGFDGMERLMNFLTENCCGGEACGCGRDAAEAPAKDSADRQCAV